LPPQRSRRRALSDFPPLSYSPLLLGGGSAEPYARSGYPEAFAGCGLVFDDLFVFVLGGLVGVAESVASFANAGLLGRSDVPGLELSTGPRVTALPIYGVEGLAFGVFAVLVEVVAVA
jgi:hypothetical protein